MMITGIGTVECSYSCSCMKPIQLLLQLKVKLSTAESIAVAQGSLVQLNVATSAAEANTVATTCSCAEGLKV